MDNILTMVVKKNKKLELEFNFYLQGCLRIHITHLSKELKNLTLGMKLYTDADGFVINTGYVCNYSKQLFTIPSYVNYSEDEDYTDTDFYTYFNFLTDKDRYDSLKKLYQYMYGLSQSRVFQYDNTGCVVAERDKWTIY